MIESLENIKTVKELIELEIKKKYKENVSDIDITYYDFDRFEVRFTMKEYIFIAEN